MLIRAIPNYKYRRNDRKVVALACRESVELPDKAWRMYRNPKTMTRSCVIGMKDGKVVTLPAINWKIRDDRGGRRARIYQNSKGVGFKTKVVHKTRVKPEVKKYTGEMCKVTYLL